MLKSLPVILLARRIPKTLWVVFWIETAVQWIDWLAFYLLGAGHILPFAALSALSFIIGVVSFLLYWNLQRDWHGK